MVLASLLAAGCAPGGNAASQLAKLPELPTDKETKCGVVKSSAEPLIVEWPDAARGKLESLARRGLVAVSYRGCDMSVLAQCRVRSTSYQYSPLTRKSSHIKISDQDELYANLPVGAAKLEGELQKSGELNVEMTLVGRFDTPRLAVGVDELEGDCEGATHVITALTVGAFTFFAGAEAEVGAGGAVLGVGAGAKSGAKKSVLTQDGEVAACGRATMNDKHPPDGCGALIRLEVVRLGAAGSGASPSPDAPAGAAGAAGAAADPPGTVSRQAEKQAFKLREEASRKRGLGDGAGCLADLDRADKIDPTTADEGYAQSTRYMCELQVGKCEQGKKRLIRWFDRWGGGRKVTQAEIASQIESFAPKSKCRP